MSSIGEIDAASWLSKSAVKNYSSVLRASIFRSWTNWHNELLGLNQSAGCVAASPIDAEAGYDKRQWAGSNDDAGADHDPADAAHLSAGNHHLALVIHANHHCVSLLAAGSGDAGSSFEPNFDWTCAVPVFLHHEPNLNRDLRRRVRAMV